MLEKDEDDVSYRVVFLGSTCVGKTSIISRVANGLFNPHEPTTYGASFVVHKVRVGDKIVKMQIWDTAGQERYRSLGPIYYRAADVGIIVFSVTDERSAEDVDGWYEQFTSITGTDAMVVIVGNKCDLVCTINVDDMNHWAGDHGLRVFFTSALSGEGMSELFRHIASVIVSNGIRPKNVDDGTITDTSTSQETDVEPPTGRCC